MKKYKKIVVSCFMMMFLLLFGVKQASAEPQCQIVAKKGVTIDLERMSECMEDRFGFDKDSLRRGNKKKMVATVDISFNKTNPQEGEKVTALAAPKGFKNSMEDLYYTWYIIHTDDDGNYTNTIEAGKREAMGIIARGNFDPDLFGINYGAIPAADQDEDGYNAAFGGDDGVGAKHGDEVGEWDDEIGAVLGDQSDGITVMYDEKKQIVATDSITRCYRHNFGIQTDRDNLGDSTDDERAGRDRIIDCRHEFPSCGVGRVGDGSFGVAEEECWETDPTNPDTDGDGVEDEADLAGLNQTQLTWIYKPGDRIGVSVEGTTMVPISEGGEQTGFVILGYRVTNPITGAIVEPFATRGAASAYCETFLPDGVDMGDASASATGGSGSGDSTGSSSSGGSSSVAVDLEADMSAYNLGMARYDACDDSLEEMYESGDQISEDGKLNAYYKIMWATTGICSAHDESMHWTGDDSCSPGQSDLGFNYLSTVAVDETGGMILDPELSVIPEKPQFDAVEPNVDDKRSDMITINTSMSNDGLNEDHLYYRWIVERCVGNDFTNCNVDVSANLKFESFREGMGIREVKFIPTNDAVFGGAGVEKVWLKATVIASEHEALVGDSDTDAAGHTVGAIESIFFPLVRNIIDIDIRSAEVSAGGLWTTDASIVPGGLICDTNLYKDICPVYPYQVIVADVSLAGPLSPNDRFSWQINDKKIEAPENCTDIAGVGACSASQTDRIYIPIQAVQDEILSLQLTLKRTDASGLVTEHISQRILSAASPKPVIEVVGGATATTRFDGTLSDSVFEADNGTAVTFRAAPVPRYLTINADAVQEDHEVDLIWYINDAEVDAQFIADNKFLLGTAVAGDQISFNIPNDMTLATGIDLKARFVKKFGSGPGPLQHDEMLKSTWRINDTHTLSSDTSVSVRTSFNMALAQDTTLKQYMASSLSNAPHYLVFIIRLAIALVFIWSILFGFSYAVKLNKEL